jgi:DNA-binding FadR family transcriptional regulator
MNNVASTSLAERAAAQIMDMILIEQRFQTGDKLPNEMELAQELGISRVTLREAVRILCTRGLVEIHRGRGTYVVSSDPTLFSDAGHDLLDGTGASIRDLLEIRLMVEPMAAYYAARRATDAQIDEIDALRLKIEELAAQGRPFLREEQAFHNAIATASRNSLMKQLMPIINKSIFADITYFKESVTYSLQDHREIAHYIRARNAEGARTVMRMHIIHCYQISNQEIE